MVRKKQHEAEPRREHKDRLFTYLFSQPDHQDWMISLVNALSGSHYAQDEPIQVTTLDDVLYITLRNDVSYVIDNQMILVEHQSSFNRNMPLRGLFYFARLYQSYVDDNQLDVHRTSLQKIPTPQFYVIYNGERETEDRILLRLSDAYFTSNDQVRSEFEWTATMLNINQGHNAGLLNACRPLREYQEFVTLVRDGQTVHHLSLSAAINTALEQAISRNFLNGLFKKLRREIVDILTKEYTEEEMKKLFYEDGMEEGRADGFALGHAEGFAQGHAEGCAKGRAEGLAEGRAEGRAEALAEIERLKAQIAQLTAK